MDWNELLDLAWNHPVPALVTLLVVLSGVVHVTIIVIELLTLFVKHLTGQLIEGRTALQHLQAALVRLRRIFRRDEHVALSLEPEPATPKPSLHPQSNATKNFLEHLRHRGTRTRKQLEPMHYPAPFPASARSRMGATSTTDRIVESYARDAAE